MKKKILILAVTLLVLVGAITTVAFINHNNKSENVFNEMENGDINENVEPEDETPQNETPQNDEVTDPDSSTSSDSSVTTTKPNTNTNTNTTTKPNTNTNTTTKPNTNTNTNTTIKPNTNTTTPNTNTGSSSGSNSGSSGNSNTTEKPPVQSTKSASELYQKLADESLGGRGMSDMSSDALSLYGIDASIVKSYSLYITMMSPGIDEICVVEATDGNISKIESAMKDRIKTLKDEKAFYPSDDEAVENAKIFKSGNFIVLYVVGDSSAHSKAESIISNY